jgi:hypothetical protein
MNTLADLLSSRVKAEIFREHFITTVLSEPRLFVIGSEDELKAMGR